MVNSVWSSPRLNATPAELMRGCSFAETFVSIPRVQDNFGDIQGTLTIDNGFTAAGGGQIVYDVVEQAGDFTVTIKFTTSTTNTAGILCCSDNLVVLGPLSGFCVWVDSDGVKARSSSAATLSSLLEVDIDYADGVEHTVSYIVEQNTTHTLVYDTASDGNFDTDTHNFSGTVSDSKPLYVGGFSTFFFTGTISNVLIFDDILSNTEHDLYVANTTQSFADSPTSVWRCDAFGDDTVGNKIWDKTVTGNDLIKADGTTSANFPTFDTDHYVFDGTGDYITGSPTVSPGSMSYVDAVGTFPSWTYNATNSFFDILEGGTYGGNLYNVVHWPTTLVDIQKKHAEYLQHYLIYREESYNYYQRLVVDGSAIGEFFTDVTSWNDYNVHPDYGTLGADGASTNTVTRNGADGVTFPNANSHILVDDEVGLRTSEGTVAVLVDVDVLDSCYLCDKGSDFRLRVLDIGGGNMAISFNGVQFPSNVSFPFKFVAITFKTGYRARLYIDGYFVEMTTSNITQNGTTTTDLFLGNSVGLTNVSPFNIKQFYFGNKPLTDNEILALYESATHINANR